MSLRPLACLSKRRFNALRQREEPSVVSQRVLPQRRWFFLQKQGAERNPACTKHAVADWEDTDRTPTLRGYAHDSRNPFSAPVSLEQRVSKSILSARGSCETRVPAPETGVKPLCRAFGCVAWFFYLLAFGVCGPACADVPETLKKPEQTVKELSGLGPDATWCRQDPSIVVQVGDTY